MPQGGCSADKVITDINLDGTVVCSSFTVQRRVAGVCAAGSSIRLVKDDGTVDCEVDDDTAPSPSVWQKRVSGTCSTGSAVRSIDVNGEVTCELDDDTIPSPTVWQVRVEATCAEQSSIRGMFDDCLVLLIRVGLLSALTASKRVQS